MCALSSAVRPAAAAGVPRRAAAASSDASERASSGKKRPRAAPARDSSACLTKMTRNRNSAVTDASMQVITVGGEVSAQELLQKRLACELEALRGLLKKAELISRRAGRGACNGGAATAGKKQRILAPKQQPKPIEDGGNAPSVKRRKISTLVGQKKIPAPRISTEERNQLAGRLASLCVQLPVPGPIVVFLEKQFGDADKHGEIEINIDSVEDSVMFELKRLLDKFADESKVDKVAEESKDDKIAEERKDHNKLAEESKSDSDQIMGTSAQQPSETASGTAQTTVQAENVPGESTGGPAPLTAAASEAKESVQEFQHFAPKAVYVRPLIDMPGLIYRANLRRELLAMERAALPDERIHPRELQRLGISEYGHPGLMRQLGLVLKAEA